MVEELHPDVVLIDLRMPRRDGVKNYISSVLAKTGLRDRTQAALYATRRGLVTP